MRIYKKNANLYQKLNNTSELMNQTYLFTEGKNFGSKLVTTNFWLKKI